MKKIVASMLACLGVAVFFTLIVRAAVTPTELTDREYWREMGNIQCAKWRECGDRRLPTRELMATCADEVEARMLKEARKANPLDDGEGMSKLTDKDMLKCASDMLEARCTDNQYGSAPSILEICGEDLLAKQGIQLK